MTDVSHEEAEDPFVFFEERIAAQVRQLFRAIRAEDSMAIELSISYLGDFLTRTLARHLRDHPRWDTGKRWLDGLNGAAPEVTPPERFTLRDRLTWATPGSETLVCGAIRVRSGAVSPNRGVSAVHVPIRG